MKTIEKAKNYYITRRGEVKNKTGHSLSLRCNRDGYVYAELYENNRSTAYTVHRMVAIAFIPNPEDKPCVNHIDGDKTNNGVENLEWVTYSENNFHAFATGLSKPQIGEDNPAAKYTEEQVHDICDLMQKGYRNIDIVEELSVGINVVKNIRRGSSWLYISEQYKIPKRSQAVSEDAARWVCRKIEEGYRNTDIVGMSRNPRIRKHIVSQIKTGKMHPNVSKDFNF